MVVGVDVVVTVVEVVDVIPPFHVKELSVTYTHVDAPVVCIVVVLNE